MRPIARDDLIRIVAGTRGCPGLAAAARAVDAFLDEKPTFALTRDTELGRACELAYQEMQWLVRRAASG